jgi:hypothetical protein
VRSALFDRVGLARKRPAGGRWVPATLLALVASCHGEAPVVVGTDRLGPCASRTLDLDQQRGLEIGNTSSHWLSPWRAWQDTWPAGRLAAVAGVRFSDDGPAAIAARAPVVAAAGLRRYSIGVPWGAMDYERPDRLSVEGGNRLRMQLAPLVSRGLRPALRLHASVDAPAPALSFEAVLVAGAAAGATTVHIDSATAGRIEVNRSGLDLEGIRAGWLFTSVDGQGNATLSRPLTAALEPGPHPATTLRYPPFSRPRLRDGLPNPAFEAPLEGWLAFVRAVARETRSVIGSEAFDLTFWATGGASQSVLEINEYYAAPVDTTPGTPYEDTPRAILKRSLEALRTGDDPFLGIGMGDAFAEVTSLTPESASTAFAGTSALVRQVHLTVKRLPGDWERGPFATLDALRHVDGAFAPDGLWTPAFIPTYDVFFPEIPLNAIFQSNFRPGQIYRDLSPLRTAAPNGTRHGRGERQPGQPPLGVWVDSLVLDAGDDGAMMSPAERQRVDARWALRGLVAHAAKGADAVFLQSALGDGGLVAPDAPDGGFVMAALGRLLAEFGEGSATGAPVWFSGVSGCGGGQQFAGDGTAAHPALPNREVVAAFPFRIARGHLAIAAYVMTRNVLSTLPKERYRLTFDGVEGDALVADARDPIDDVAVDVALVERRGGRATIELALGDSPIVVHLRTR